jgi:hypothetical protein
VQGLQAHASGASVGFTTYVAVENPGCGHVVDFAANPTGIQPFGIVAPRQAASKPPLQSRSASFDASLVDKSSRFVISAQPAAMTVATVANATMMRRIAAFYRKTAAFIRRRAR